MSPTATIEIGSLGALWMVGLGLELAVGRLRLSWVVGVDVGSVGLAGACDVDVCAQQALQARTSSTSRLKCVSR